MSCPVPVRTPVLILFYVLFQMALHLYENIVSKATPHECIEVLDIDFATADIVTSVHFVKLRH